MKYQLKQIQGFGNNTIDRSQSREMIAYLCCLFLPAVCSPKVFTERINERTPLWQWLALDNIAFLLLVLENYYAKWELEAKGTKLVHKYDGLKYGGGRGLSSKDGQHRYHQLNCEILALLNDTESAEQFEKAFWHTLSCEFGWTFPNRRKALDEWHVILRHMD